MPHVITDRCDGCSACVKQCPEKAITGEFKRRFQINERRCSDCGVCGTICARGSVVDQHGQPTRRIPRAERPRPVVDPSLCNGCGICLEFCSFGCRSVVGPQFFGLSLLAHPVQCVSCGECASMCSKDAITMTRMDLRTYDPHAEAGRLRQYLDELR